MAAKFWVGGTGNTSDNVNHWSATDGGAPGAAAPTSVDDVFFTSLSSGAAYTVTVDATFTCRDLTFAAPAAGNVTLAGAATINFFGSFAFYAGLVRTFSGPLNSNHTSGTQTFTSAGVSLASALTAAGVGGTLQLADAYSSTNTLAVLAGGGLDLNGKSVACGTISVGNSVSTFLTFGAATIAATGNVAIGATAIVSAASLVSLSIAGNSVNFGGHSFGGTVTLTGLAPGTDGGNTFVNLRHTPGGNAQVILGGNVTVTGTLTITGVGPTTTRDVIFSSVRGVVRTITAANVVASNADFQDIVGAGTGNWNLSIIAGGSGDCGGNSGITFTAPATQYWFHGASASYNWSDPTRWFLATGGTGGAGRVPLPQDLARFDSGSFAAVGKTVVQDMPRIGPVDWTGVTNAPIFTTSTTASFFGSITLATGMTLTATGAGYTYEGRGASVLISAGNTWTKNLGMASASGSLTLGDAFTNTASLAHDSGTFNSAGFAVAILNLTYSSPAASVITMGASTWTLSGVWTAPPTITVNAGTSTIRLVGTLAAAGEFRGQGKTYYNLENATSGAFPLNVTGANTFNNILINPGRSTLFTAATVTTFSSLTALGTRALPITIGSTTAATHTLAHSGSGLIQVRYCSISFSIATGSGMIAHVSTDGGSNTGWSFPAARFWVGASGNWSDATNHWAAASGGAPGAGNLPVLTTDAVFDDQSGAAPTVTVDAPLKECLDLIIQAPTSGNMTLAGSAAIVNVYGNLSGYAGLACPFSNYLTLKGVGGSLALDWNNTASQGQLQTGASVTATYLLVAPLKCTYLFGNSAAPGGLDTNGFNIIGNNGFSWVGSGSLDLRSGTHALNGNVDLRIATFNGANATVTSGGGNGFVTPVTGQIKSLTLSSNSFASSGCTFGDLIFTGGGGGLGMPITGNITCLTFAARGTSDFTRVGVFAANAKVPITINAASIAPCQYCDFVGIIGAGAATWDLSAIVGGAGDGGGNSGIIFSAPRTVYWVGNGGSSTALAHWASTSGGAGGSGRVPLLQDTERFDANSFTLPGQVVSHDMQRCGSVDFTGATNAPTWSGYYNEGICGPLFRLAPGVIWSSTAGYPVFVVGGADCVFDLAGATFTGSAFVVSNGATAKLGSHFAVAGGIRVDSNATFDANGFNVTHADSGGVSMTIQGNLKMGSGVWTNAATLAGNGALFDVGCTVDAGTSTLRFTGALLGNQDINQLKVAGITLNIVEIAHTGAFATRFIGRNHTMNRLHIDASAGPRTILFNNLWTYTLGAFTRDFLGTNTITIGSVGTGQHTLVKSGGGTVVMRNLNVSRSTATPGATWIAASSIDGGNNVGWTFILGSLTTVAIATWATPTATRTVGPTTRVTSAAIATWSTPTAQRTPGPTSRVTTAAVASWVAKPAGALSTFHTSTTAPSAAWVTKPTGSHSIFYGLTLPAVASWFTPTVNRSPGIVSKSLTVVSAAWAVPDAGSDTYSTTTPVSIDISPVITVSFDP